MNNYTEDENTSELEAAAQNSAHEESDGRRDYTEFWQNGLNKIEQISGDIDLLCRELAAEFKNLDPIFKRLEQKAATLSSIHSGINAIAGREYVMRLYAVIKKYKENFSSEAADFKLINFLLEKIKSMRNGSFEYFPWMQHSTDTAEETSGVSVDPETSPFKWVSFKSGDSWFLCRFSTLEIAEADACEYASAGSEGFTITLNGKTFVGRYIFSSFAERRRVPACFLIINGGRQVFGADAHGRRVYSEKDFISKLLKPFETPINNPLVKGRVRLFGINHLLINS